ncbi:hypothetical protein HBI56_017050 [Parastagonospora nodorum]|uniref:Uncharacterized protein n=1 Tax=Phaeosphaeria nodorum (strain SN15 / ATCC MYA-4574 / FGSC 10173) TaxID=321614 RepID=A0A7U2F127_PHANO|nr:hypothetical protein HBH56_082950 [Parastagonospora nodorum]QRC96698.1 hypothetical protein JI435_409470 [Parastagonospora nodorum SN15]KAH3929914.1 hypothetical protein HBH54_118880 [Parastagonospora nodorum]KAH3955502.1 hypothetical protein HBH53_005680 [Parastagonospora nodorum]KAH3976833.1 hypothetical protein HBH51_075830 [Parastagonospora nodorum]
MRDVWGDACMQRRSGRVLALQKFRRACLSLGTVLRAMYARCIHDRMGRAKQHLPIRSEGRGSDEA